ncbi:pentatricopeptide repeat-containing protein At3g53360, mitochondrial isoform X1 [Phoenix dactylifera]|uniref:Pentatricopeptide repeat-containing protein At3g53360, mitochondrial isoform X1 n=1 Tax=Phoenix dactylifera TaxID=42345 RepID=A0A8B9AUQ2_PHODC|nr:pentatricopeptide repeat-containing protein At3g53360, mitochondrial isoform X1 [Phoenix dactylifera]XP_038990198.1 pentatricopeptide repeat-containing protein At3g53360, mitochondrial isoform X1 [Phoenix dactylifera]XP_038990199.1 pentatricopeptide repeat-containing protein At3g53360, mitochondrial isoform X1 [Phoenix dactylifera]XP_038990200.1 pentatricopeptide repeat-containing protein At3g53360, mitochondrial isoform X1 [Phoenix dactylifera]XP_038990201.1 pentatricopeptide repeat-contain
MVMILKRLGALLQQCSKTKASNHGAAVHAVIIKMGLGSDLVLSNHLINMYAKCNNFKAAHKVFDEMPNRNLVSWSAMIAGYDQSGNPLMALNLFARMQLLPNEYIYASVLSACASILALNQGKQVHAHSLKSGYDNVSFVFNSLMSMYMKCGCFDDAFIIFSSVSEPNSISYNAMITGFAESSQLEKGLELFRLMNQRGLHPDQFSCVAVCGICTTLEDLETGRELHCQTIKLGVDSSAFVGNVILTMYSRCGSMEEVERVFRSITKKDVITCNTYIVACSHCGQPAKGLMVYREMEEMENAFGIRPDDFTLASALAACAELASIQYGHQIHARLIRTRIHLDVGVGNSVINMYAKCGCIAYAHHVFQRLLNRNLVSWNTMIVGLGNHGYGKNAVEIFEQMKTAGVQPDSVTFIGLLTACSHAGLVDQGLAYYNSMQEIHSISPKIEHLSCLVDMLGRAGRLEEAEVYVKVSSFVNDLVIWGSLLSSCRLHKDVIVGERVARKLLELQPSTSSPYVLLSNLYALDGRWDGVAEARRLLKGSGVKKEPGHSLIQIKGISEKFTAGDFSHARIEEIVETLDNLNLKAKRFHL